MPREFYTAVLERFRASDVPFLLGGAYALGVYTGVHRDTKDLDLFIRPEDCDRALALFPDCKTCVLADHWLAKIFSDGAFVDLIFGSRNGICVVDEAWFEGGDEAVVLGVPVKAIPVEEMIWSKGFIMERDRFDGADVAHLIRARGRRMDWTRLITRFGPNAPVLLIHLILFGFIYPSEKDLIPAWVFKELRKAEKLNGVNRGLCRGTLLSQVQYRPDVEAWGYRDARLPPCGRLRPDQLDS